MESAMRAMLVKLSYLLKPDEVNNMKYLCKDFIPLKRREEIKGSIDLFNELEQRGKLKCNDISFIEFLLESACAGRTDVLELLSFYIKNNLQSREKESGTENGHGQSQCNSEELSAAFAFLEENLGKEYLMVLRRLGVDDHTLDRLKDENPRNIKEVIHKALKLWHSSKCNGSCIMNVIAALKGERRNDLAAKIEARQIT